MKLRTPAPKRKAGALPGSNNGGGARQGSTKPAGSGRAVGTQNKITLTAKQAIAEFVDGNAHRLTGWLDQVANGSPMLDKDSKQVYDSEGNMIYAIRPNPEKAFNLFQSVVEYHVPKLARSEISGPNGSAIQTSVVDLKGLSDIELEQVQTLLSKAAST
jgi:hypothetical protein|tara:strand:- start:45 stop:521 length:477 start_codon:yes stop_codon:yes gene_type:complete